MAKAGTRHGPGQKPEQESRQGQGKAGAMSGRGHGKGQGRARIRLWPTPKKFRTKAMPGQSQAQSIHGAGTLMQDLNVKALRMR